MVRVFLDLSPQFTDLQLIYVHLPEDRFREILLICVSCGRIYVKGPSNIHTGLSKPLTGSATTTEEIKDGNPLHSKCPCS